MSEQKADGNEGGNYLQLNGMSVEELAGQLFGAYNIIHEDTQTEKRQDPNADRQRRIKGFADDIEEIVKKHFEGNEVRVTSKSKADAIIKDIAYQLALTEGFKGKIEEFSDQEAARYLTHAANETGNPLLGNKVEFAKNLMNMIAAKPGDTQYDTNSALGTLISYIAAQKDEESKLLNYLRTLVGQYWNNPETAHTLQSVLGGKFNIPLNPSATAQDFFIALGQNVQIESQRYAASGDKTYLQRPKTARPVVGGPSVDEQKQAA